jgi:hypothetical protein
MPFSYELISEDNHAGKFIIDRKNILFTWPEDFDRRDLLAQWFTTHSITVAHRNWDGSYPATDLRHEAVKHVSSYDKSAMHYHYTLTKNVDLEIIESLFAQIEKHYAHDHSINHIMSPQNRVDILAAVRAYFADLENNPITKSAEIEYLHSKEQEMKRAEEIVEDNEAKAEVDAAAVPFQLIADAAIDDEGFYGAFAKNIQTSQGKKALASAVTTTTTSSSSSTSSSSTTRSTSGGFYDAFAKNIQTNQGKKALASAVTMTKPSSSSRTHASSTSSLSSTTSSTPKSSNGGFYSAFAENMKKARAKQALMSVSTPTSPHSSSLKK